MIRVEERYGIEFRPVMERDYELVKEAINDVHAVKMLCGRDTVMSDEEFQKHFKAHFMFTFIVLRGGLEIGVMKFWNIGVGMMRMPWALLPKYRGRGWGREAFWTMARAFPCVKIGEISPDNDAAIKCHEFAGHRIFKTPEGDQIHTRDNWLQVEFNPAWDHDDGRSS